MLGPPPRVENPRDLEDEHLRWLLLDIPIMVEEQSLLTLSAVATHPPNPPRRLILLKHCWWIIRTTTLLLANREHRMIPPMVPNQKPMRWGAAAMKDMRHHPNANLGQDRDLIRPPPIIPRRARDHQQEVVVMVEVYHC